VKAEKYTPQGKGSEGASSEQGALRAVPVLKSLSFL
jgi:hypothetical protein